MACGCCRRTLESMLCALEGERPSPPANCRLCFTFHHQEPRMMSSCPEPNVCSVDTISMSEPSANDTYLASRVRRMSVSCCTTRRRQHSQRLPCCGSMVAAMSAVAWIWKTYARAVAAELGCVIVSVDYPLAPETPFPGSVEDCYAVLRWLHANAGELGVDTGRLAVGGGSAGGGLAAALALLARDRG